MKRVLFASFIVVGACILVVASSHGVMAQAVGGAGNLDFATPLCQVWLRIRAIAGPVALLSILAGIVGLMIGGDDIARGPLRIVVGVVIALIFISGVATILSFIPGITSC